MQVITDRLSLSHSLDPQEVRRFDQLAHDWWQSNGAFKLLHQMNPVRLGFIRDALITHFNLPPNLLNILKGLSIVDVGCGGGLVTEPLARLGATVTGIDASPQAIAVATHHSHLMELEITYVCQSVETLGSQDVCFDVVIALEILEHVTDVASFLKLCTSLVHEKGCLIFSTLNRTLWSYLTAIMGAEYVLRMLPVGTHEWNKFLTPAEVADHLRLNGFQVETLSGLSYGLLSKQWTRSHDLSINYIGYARRS